MTTSVGLSPVAILQFFDNTGKPCIGGTLLTQSGGVNYPTYSEPTGTTALPNPIPLNSRGEISTAVGTSTELFLQTGVAYTFTLKDAAGNQLWSVGNITAMNGQAVSLPTASGTANAQIVTNPVPISLGPGVIQWLLPVAANTGQATVNVDNTGAKNIFFSGYAVAGGELEVGVPAQIIYDGTQWELQNPCIGIFTNDGSITSTTMSILNNSTTYNLFNGLTFRVKAAATSTASGVIRVGATAGINIYYSDGTTQLIAGAIIANNIYMLTYDSSLNSSAGGFICINPSRVQSSFTLTLTGMSAGTTGTVNYAIGNDGKTVLVTVIADILGTSNATTMTGTGWPASLIPATAKNIQNILLRDGGVIGYNGTFQLPNSGTTVTFSNSPATITSSLPRAFTNTGSKGIISCIFSYTLD